MDEALVTVFEGSLSATAGGVGVLPRRHSQRSGFIPQHSVVLIMRFFSAIIKASLIQINAVCLWAHYKLARVTIWIICTFYIILTRCPA